jgi:hypothetical protein
MALRQLASRLALRGMAPPPAQLQWARAAAGSAPSVMDRVVQVTVVDRSGRRHIFGGLEGQSVADVIAANVETLGEDGGPALVFFLFSFFLSWPSTSNFALFGLFSQPYSPFKVCTRFVAICPWYLPPHPRSLSAFSSALAVLGLSPYGRGAADAHIKVPNEMLARVPAPEGDERKALEELAAGKSIDQQ